MNAFLKAVHCLALCLALGGPLFWTCIWHQVIDSTAFESLLQFLIGTRYGNMTLFKCLLMPLFLLSVVRLSTSYPRLAQVCAALCGLALLTTLSLTSHAAAKPGIVPVLSETIHLAGVVVWGGGLLYFALLPWKTLRRETEMYGRSLWKLVERFPQSRSWPYASSS